MQPYADSTHLLQAKVGKKVDKYKKNNKKKVKKINWRMVVSDKKRGKRRLWTLGRLDAEGVMWMCNAMVLGVNS